MVIAGMVIDLDDFSRFGTEKVAVLVTKKQEFC